MNQIISLQQVFNDRLFVVPDYQRGYAWEKDQRRDLLEDLEEMPAGKTHYTGTLVLHPLGGSSVVDSTGAGFKRFEVVDGQQRLTTLVILLSVIARAHRHALVDRATLAAGVRKHFVCTEDLAGAPLYKLRLAKELDTFFTDAVLADTPTYTGEARTAAEKRLMEARAEFTAYIDAQSQRADFAAWLLELQTKITQGLQVGLYVAEDAADVGVIFEVMNNRGRPLTELEKVKNLLIYLSTRLSSPEFPTERFRALVNESWATIYERLMGAGLSAGEMEDQLLRAHWLATINHDPKSWRGSRGIKERFALKKHRGQERELLQALMGYVQTLRDAAVAFVDAYRPWRESAYAALPEGRARDEARRWGEKIARMWVVAPFVPLLIATRLRNPTDGQVIVDLLKMCETFAFRVYRLGGLKSNTGQSNLYQQAHLRYDGKTDDAKVIENVRGLLHWYHGEHKIPERLAEKPRDEDNNWYEWYGLRYFLYEWEEHRAGAIGVKKPWHDVITPSLAETVEHILPQSATDPYWQQHFTDAERKRYTHDLGNLVLTQYNPSLSNRDFDTKKGMPAHGEKCYANSNLASERELASLKEWNVTELKKRRQAMVEWAITRWGAPRPAAPPIAPLPDDEEG
ncbi:MAG: DUF262 domain-containing HNH endonuclease family protein [Polyangiales bacterium]